MRWWRNVVVGLVWFGLVSTSYITLSMWRNKFHYHGEWTHEVSLIRAVYRHCQARPTLVTRQWIMSCSWQVSVHEVVAINVLFLGMPLSLIYANQPPQFWYSTKLLRDHPHDPIPMNSRRYRVSSWYSSRYRGGRWRDLFPFLPSIFSIFWFFGSELGNRDSTPNLSSTWLKYNFTNN